MFKTVNALVLREVRYKEADRILTLLTDTDGKITVKARGALRKSSKTAAATQQLTYSEMTLFGNLGRWTVNEAAVKEGFDGLRADIGNFALGCYFAECVDALSVEDQPDALLMQLALNCLYALSRGMYTPEHIKAAFELRLMCLVGYTPELSHCAVCGEEEPGDPVLMLERGCVCCRRCAAGAGQTVKLDTASLNAMRHICSVSPKQILSFSLEGEGAKRLSAAAEEYLLLHTERRFPTLDYWKNVKI